MSGASFVALKALPSNGQPITGWANQDEAFTDVVAGLRRVIEDPSFFPARASRADFPPVWNVPYPRNTFFTGREELLTELHTRFQSGRTMALTQPQAVSGLGGIGKTQIAIEYAYRFRHDYQYVLWARAETSEALTTSAVAIAQLLQLPQKDAQEQQVIIQAVKHWLQTQEQWLLILDNADTLALVRDFLPPILGGHLLLTTRARAMGRLAYRIEVNTLSTEQGALFLLHRSALVASDVPFEKVSIRKRDLAMQIARELGELPLALDQAGAYIEEIGCSLSDYLQRYQRYHIRLLEERRG